MNKCKYTTNLFQSDRLTKYLYLKLKIRLGESAQLRVMQLAKPYFPAKMVKFGKIPISSSALRKAVFMQPVTVALKLPAWFQFYLERSDIWLYDYGDTQDSEILQCTVWR